MFKRFWRHIFRENNHVERSIEDNVIANALRNTFVIGHALFVYAAQLNYFLRFLKIVMRDREWICFMIFTFGEIISSFFFSIFFSILLLLCLDTGQRYRHPPFLCCAYVYICLSFFLSLLCSCFLSFTMKYSLVFWFLDPI